MINEEDNICPECEHSLIEGSDYCHNCDPPQEWERVENE